MVFYIYDNSCYIRACCIETNRKGVFDLEILPAVYLIKSFLNTPKLSIVAMIWLTTFGRHLISTNNDAKEVKFFRIKINKKIKIII